MIFLFVPYYDKWNDYFQQCLDNQTEEFVLMKYNRKEMGDYWTHACNFFLKQLKTYRGITNDDVVCIMNNDIRFGWDLMAAGNKVKENEILIPFGSDIQIDWKTKKMIKGNRIDTFPGRTFFMKATDFINSGGFSKLLPHYLSDYDFGIRMIKKGMRVVVMNQPIRHIDHPKNNNPWSIRSTNNPVFWTIFLLKHGRNRYFFLNLLKVWAGLILKINQNEQIKKESSKSNQDSKKRT